MTDKLSTKDLLFAGNRITGTLFTANPWKVAGGTSAIAILFLNLPAWCLGLAHVSNDEHLDVGYFAKPNWWLVYPVMAPALLFLGIWAFRKMHIAVYQLIEDSPYRKPVIVDRNGKAAEDYPSYLAAKLANSSKKIFLIATFVAILVTILDTKDLWPGFFNGGHFEASRVREWDTAYGIRQSSMYGHAVANFLFDLVAYTFQTGLIFLGIFFLLKYWMFFRTMVQIIDNNNPPYSFKPWICDLHRRLGLKPLGMTFNFFLIVVFLFQLYAFLHRIQLIDSYHLSPPNTYLKTIWSEINKEKKEGLFPALKLLFGLTPGDYAWQGLMNPSCWLPLLFSVPPILVICLLPIGKLFFYLRGEVERLTNIANVEYANATNPEDEKSAGKTEDKKKCLEESTIWPNGSTTGSVFLVMTITLVAGTICPPLLLWGLTTGIILKIVWSLLGKPFEKKNQ